MMVSAIAAMAKNRVIGTSGKLPWHIPEDLKFFREKTLGKIIIMGRKTFESVGSKPMPKRLNVVITRNAGYEPVGAIQALNADEAVAVLQSSNFETKGVFVFTSIEEALKFSKLVVGKTERWGDEVMICGGEEIYRLAMTFTDRIYLTVVEQDFKGDAKFPEFDDQEFRLKEKLERHDSVAFSFCTYER